MKKETAEKILQETEIGYDLISKKFSQTRKHFWRGLEFIKDYAGENDNILDFGCGNGRLLELFDQENINYWGVDVSGELIGLAKDKYDGGDIHFSKISPIQASLPFETGFFNAIYSIAVFHHFPSKEYREKIALELYRVTAENGHVVITAWYLWQRKYFRNILKNWLIKVRAFFGGPVSIREVKPSLAELDWNDCMISFTDNSGTKFQRFHHAFTKRELNKLFEKAGFEIKKCGIIDGRNIVLIGKKPKVE